MLPGEACRLIGVSARASLSEIRRAYRKQAKEVHPDRGGDSRQFIRLHEAYEALVSPGHEMLFPAIMARDPAVGEPRREQTRGHRPIESAPPSTGPVPKTRPPTTGPPLPSSGMPPPKEDRDLVGALGFTVFCAAVVLTRTAGMNVGWGRSGILLAIVTLLLVGPSLLAALAGATDRKRSRGIYTGVVFTLTIAMYFGVVGVVERLIPFLY